MLSERLQVVTNRGQDEIIQAPTGSSGGITPTPPDPEDPDPETEERIKDEECKENNMTTEAINCIQNSGLEFPCEEVGTDDVWDNIVDSLCDDANDGQNS